MSAPEPWRHDRATMPCPVRGAPFVPSGQRRRHQSAPAPVALLEGRSRRAVSVHERPSCERRLVEEQRCAERGAFARRVGLGGWCPRCDEAVTVAELVGDGVVAEDAERRKR